MNTKIELTYQDINYTLEYDRMSVKILENNGFRLDEFLEKPINNIELAFQCAFIKNHPKVKMETITNIFNSCPNKEALIIALRTMIDECYQSLLSDDNIKDDDSGNVIWKTVDLSPKKTSQK